MAEALGVASSVIAVVDLSAKVFSLCLQYSREVKNAKDDIERLRKEVADFQTTTEQVRDLVEGPRGQELEASRQLDSAIKDGWSTLEELAQALEPSKHRKAMSRLGVRALKWPFESKDFEGTIQHLARCRGNILLALNVDQTAIIQNVDHKIALDRLPIAEGASFDSHAEEHNPTCLPDTRVDLLEDVSRWIADPNSKTIYWLNGMAGTGKSTISRTVARSRSKQGDLGASFFFKRGETDRGNLAKFVSTLARQLALSIPEVAPFIKKVTDSDAAIVDKAVREQFEKLVREPLSKAAATATTPSSVVIVVDALDECESDVDIKLLLELFSNACSMGPLRVRVLVTSRPELPVRLGFRSIDGTYQDLVLHKIPQSIIEHDIFVFLRHEFAKIRKNFNNLTEEELKLPMHWPGETNLRKLTMAATPLFIFAATLCRFINDSCLGSPDELLQRVLNLTGNSHASKLDMTYSPVLEQQVINRSGRERRDVIESFRLIVGTIVTLASPLSMRALALLFDVHIDKVTTRLKMLHSVLEVPGTLDSPVRLLHLSFRDYLVNPENKETLEFWVDEKLAHRNLAKHCLHLMRGALRENVCGLSFPGMRQSAVDALQLEKYIPPQLQYACLYWVHHQTKIDFEPNDSHEIYDFLTTHFLRWLEALSLMGRARDGLDSLRSLADWLGNRGDSNLSNFLADAVRFLQANFSVINDAPLQIYSSALVFAPKRSLIRTSFENSVPAWLTIRPRVKEDWDACLLTLEGHSDEVRSVVFSHDSSMVASASYDKTVRIWNAKTGRCEQVLEGHSWPVSSVAFSPDSTMVASASYDKTVRIWNAKTGRCEQVLEGHSSPVSSVVFSHDSSMVASASRDKTVRIWNAKTGKCEQVLEGHSDNVNSAVFSHDSTKVASASSDKTVRIWNAKTGKCEQVLEGHSWPVSSVAFSPDSTMVASASYDKTVRIWNAKTGRCEQVLEGHSDWVRSAVFSPDSTMVASASYDKTVRIWNAETGNCDQVLEGHSMLVNSVVFSPDSTMVASASDDETVRIWNVETGDCERVLEGHSMLVNSVVFSPDSTMVASASDDETVRVWNAKTGNCDQVLEGHSDNVNSVAFSPDSTKVASGSSDETVRVWNAKTGKCDQVLEGHSDWVNLVAFSPDSTKVASASSDKTVRVWNAETGKCDQVLEGHSSWVRSVVFSPDSMMVASASYDKTVRIWNAETGNCDQVLEGHSMSVNSVVFSPDSTMVASASDDETVRIWNTETGICKAVISLDAYADVLSFTPDERGIVTDIGVFALTGDLESSAEPPMSSRPSEVSTLGLRDGTWVTTTGTDLFWLPTECRGGQAAVSGSTVVVGCRSGRVVLLGFSGTEIPKI